jgi:hypothetical protein
MLDTRAAGLFRNPEECIRWLDQLSTDFASLVQAAPAPRHR